MVVRESKRRASSFKQISDISKRKVIFTKHRDIYTEDLDYKCHCWRRVTISDIKVRDVNIENILLALINTDFRRQPSIMGQCFFINHTRGIVLNLYDDRGMDVVALDKSTLNDVYKSHSAFILEYDRERIDHMFLSE